MKNLLLLLLLSPTAYALDRTIPAPPPPASLAQGRTVSVPCALGGTPSTKYCGRDIAARTFYLGSQHPPVVFTGPDSLLDDASDTHSHAHAHSHAHSRHDTTSGRRR